MQSGIFAALGLPLVETWCIEGVILFLNTDKKVNRAGLTGVFLLVNAFTNIPFNLILVLAGDRIPYVLLIAYLALMEGAVIPLTEALLYRKLIGIRSAARWIVISYEMNLVSYAGPLVFSFFTGGR